MMNLQGPVSRTTPGGGSASLEALVRAIEHQHLDLLESLEPLTSQSPKHIFFVTAAPPDDSQRPLWNKSNKFDDFGWSHCEEWLKQADDSKKSIALTMIYSRLPPHPRYLSLHASLNPVPIEPIPPSGPVRISLSLPIWSIMRPGGHQSGQSGPTPAPATATPSPNIVASPAPIASSPNATRKRKAPDEPQLSPRRVKFPPGTVGGSGNANTPSSSSVSSVPPRPTSVSGVRVVPEPKPENTPSHPANRNISQQPASVSLGERNNQATSQSQYPTQSIPSNPPGTNTNLPPVGRPPSTQPSSSQTVQQNSYPQDQSTSIAALGGAQGKYDLMGLLPEHIAQIQKFASSPLEQKRENLMKLQRMQQDLDMAGTKFQAENRLAEAKNEFLKRDKIREWIKRLNSAGPAVQGILTDSNIGTTNPEATNNIGGGPAPSGPTMAINPQVPSAPGNPDRTAAPITNIPPTQSIDQNTSIISAPTSTSTAPISQTGTGPVGTQLVWKGVLSVTNQEGNRVMPEILVSMFPLKSSTNQYVLIGGYLSTQSKFGFSQVSLSTWPNQLYMQPIRHQTPSHELVTWLQENKPEGVYCVKVLQLDIWSGGIQQLQQVQRFNTLRNAVINNKL
ncbi:5976_t:CDS:2, partial [Acaulospora colombiana]